MSINFLNIARSFEVNSNIVEWDMKRAGLNLVKEYNLLPEDTIKELEKLPKSECDIKIGKLQIKDKEFSKALEQKFTDVMKTFMEVNDIDDEFDVLAIKKDACFIINKKVRVSEFGKYIKFVPKNTYHAYVYLKPYEMYFKRDGDIDIKGLSSDKKTRNHIIELHKDGILNFIEYVIELAETSNMDSQKISKFLHEFVEMYKKKELEFDYYREFNIESRFRYQLYGSEVMADYIDESMLEKTNIEYNYKNIVLPLINLLC
jgi:hypothetical protein